MSKDLRFGNLNGLFQFNNYVRELIAENCVAGVELQLCDGESPQDSFFDGWSGYYFSLTAKNGTKIFPWFGVKYYIEDETWLALDFEFVENCNNQIKLKKAEICKAFENAGFGIEQDDDGINVCLQKDELEKFQQSENTNEQKTSVKDSFVKTLDVVVDDCEDPIKLNKDKICKAFENAGFGIEQDDDGISVYLQKDEFEKFQKIENADEQKSFVKDFFVKTIDIVKEFI